MIPKRLRWTGLALVSTLFLTGCSASGWNPGVAAQVADDTVTLSEVDDVTETYCSAVETQLSEGQYVANGVVAAQVVGSLALRAAAEQFAAEQGVEPDASLDQQTEQLQAGIAGLSEEQQDAVLEVNLARPYAAAVALAVGKAQVGGSDEDAATKAGQEAFASWLDEQDVRIDPRYMITIDGGTVARDDSDVTVAVSDTAKKAVSGEPDETYAAGLPTSQRCG